MIDSEMTWKQKVAALAVQLGRAPGLDELVDMARSHKMTAEEWQAQKESFVRAEMAFGSDIDWADYVAARTAGDQDAIARLETAMQARADAFDKLWGKP